MLTSRGHTSCLQQGIASVIFAHQLYTATGLCWAPVGLRLPGPGEEAERELAPDPPTVSWDESHNGATTFPLLPAPPQWYWLLILAPAQEGIHGQDPTCCCCMEIKLAAHIFLPAEQWPIWRRLIREHWVWPSTAEAEDMVAMQQQWRKKKKRLGQLVVTR